MVMIDIVINTVFGGLTPDPAGMRCPTWDDAFWFFLVTLRVAAFEGCIVSTSIALPFMGQFRRGFQRFFQKWLLFLTHYIVLIFLAR